MNKIYKVVWSKVKHCYVVTSELAKRQTKGCGARSLRMATVSLGVAASLLCTGAVLPIFGESVAEAGSSNNTVTVTEDWSGRVIGGLGGYAPNSTDKFGGASTTATDPVYNNKVIIESGTITTNGNSGGVYGGYGRTGEVSYNSITINGGTIDTYVYNVFGGVSYVDSEASIHHNTVTINDGVVHASQYIRGGYSWASAVVNENKVIITGGRISSLASVVGGESYKGIAKDNEVTISGVQGGNYVYGGRTYNGKVTNNKVSVSGSETRVGSTVGGGSQYFNENTLIEKNEVTIENGTVYSAYGGMCDSGAQVNNNTVNVNGGTVSNYVYGGLSGYGKSVSSNKVFINNGKVGNVEYGSVYGGHAHGAESAVTNNVVTITDGTVDTKVYGGYNQNNVVGGNSADEGNKVFINGGTVINAYGGASESGSAKNNAVIIDGGTVKASTSDTEGTVYGGYVENMYDDAGAVTDNTVTIKSGVVGNNYSAIYGGRSYGIKYNDSETSHKSGEVTGNKVSVEGGTVKGNVYGGYSDASYNESGDVSGNKVSISGGKVTGYGSQEVYGGYTWGKDKDDHEINASGVAKENTVTVSGGELTNTNLTGGSSNGNNAEQNKVEITEKFTGTVGNVTGGEADKNATKNEVTISGGTVSRVIGGYSTNGGIVGGDNADDGNKVTINNAKVNGNVQGGFSTSSGSTGVVKNNTVTITKGTVTGMIQGGFSTSSGSTGVVKNNTVTITKGTVTGMIQGGYGSSISNSTSDKVGDVSYNKVEIIGGKVSSVYGGENSSGRPEQSGKAEENTVSVSGDAELTSGITGGSSVTIATNNHVSISGSSKVSGIVRGGYSSNSRTDYASAASAKRNDVTISDNAELSKSVYGGYSNVGTAESNVVTIKGGTINVDSSYDFITGMTGNGVYGGFSLGSGNVLKNTVTIEGGTVNAYSGVYGGWAKNGTAGGSSADDGNKVSITGGTVSKFVYGGYSKSGAVTGNSVSISGGTVSGDVYGGYGESGNPTKNSVIISGGTFNGRGSDQLIGRQAIFGGYNHNDGSASDNTVTISGGTFIGSNGILIQGGRTYYATGTTNNNIVNLTGTVTGLENGSLLGGGSSASNTGNELHVGGTKDVTITGVWQGKTGDTVNNKVKSVDNFDKVVLHSVKWDKDVAALEATSVNNVKTLDITNLKFYTDAAGTTQKTSFEEGESMALLKSVESDLSSVKLDYKSGDTVVTGVAITTEGVILGGGATDKRETDGVNGVKLTQSVTEKVKLATDSKAISYSCEVGDVKGVTFNASTPITFSTTEVARDLTGKTFATSNTINAEGLKFKETNEAIAVSDSMTLISNATGITTTVTNETGKTVAITNYEDNQKIKYKATASGTVTSDGSAVKYTVGSVTVSSIDLSGWTGTASDLTKGNTSGWTGAGVLVAGSFTAPDIAANSSQDIVITNKSGFFTDDAIDDSIKYAVVAFSDDEANGVTLAGSQSKGVQAVSDGTNDRAKLVYTVGTKDVTGITLGTMTAVTPRTMEAGYDFTGVTTINAGNLQFDKPEDVKANMTLVANATNLLEGKTVTDADHTQDFTKTAANSVALTASLKGTVETVSGAVNYTYSGTELKTINLANWNGNEATFDATGWTKGASATVETDGLSVTVDPGVEKTVLTVSGGVVLTGITVNGEAYQWKDGGESIAETSAENGVKITAGVTTGGGIKGDGNKIIYKGSSKTVTGLEVTSVDFVKDGVAREFKNDYDLTNAAITVASGITISSNTAAMNAGDTMVIVDATKAIQGTGGATLQGFTDEPGPISVDFKDKKVDGKELTFEGTHKDTLFLNDQKTQVVYKVGEKEVNKSITFTGEIAWNDSEAYYINDASKYKFNDATKIDATALKVTGTSTKALKNGDAMTLLYASGLASSNTVTPQSDTNRTASKITVNYSDATSGIGFGAEATGAVETAVGAVNYKVTGVTLNSVDLGGWNGTTSSVPGDWAIADGATIKTDGMAAPAVEPGSHVDILQNDTDNYFASATISGANTYQSTDFKDEMNGVTLEGKQDKGVTLNSEKKHLIYAAGTKNTASVSFGAVEWQKDATLVDAVAGYDFTNVAEIGTENFAMTYAKPEDVAVNDSMTLLKANETLTAIVNELKTSSSYNNYEIAPGVLMDGDITGTMSRSGNDVVFTATENKASKLTFTNVEWKDSGALMTRPSNITFAGADVDTAKINFHNIQELAANSRMTLVSDFGETVGTITGDTFTVGSGLKGEGAASLSGTDLVFTAKTGAESLTPTEATHETVMAMEAGTAVVAAGREYVDSAVEGLGLVSNMAPDGTSTFASMGGGVGRYKTGSHVDTHTWNAVVAVGSKREHKKGSLEWGVFAEYGRGNYTLHDDNGGRGDGNTHYAGGGLLAKWTNKHDVYTEASFRMGRMSDSASNMLRDVLGNTYGYDVHANYFGGHVGLGKIYKVKGNKDLDVYGKFFYTRRNGVDFDAGGNHYSLDSVASKLLRIGARYGSNDRKWNWYGGLAYEYEFGGESKGTVDGLAIRSASIKGASVRGEIGVRMNATKTNPWQTDISIYGYGGKHRGFGGNVNVAYMF